MVRCAGWQRGARHSSSPARVYRHRRTSTLFAVARSFPWTNPNRRTVLEDGTVDYYLQALWLERALYIQGVSLSGTRQAL